MLSNRDIYTSRSLVQRSPVECVVSECDSDASKIGTPWPTGAPCAVGKKYMTLKFPISYLIFIAKARLELQGGQNSV